MNTWATIEQLLLLYSGTVNTTIEEAVLSMLFSYIHCWAMDMFSMGLPPDYISSTRQNQIRTILMKLQCLQNRVLRAIGNLDWCTPVRDLHLAFRIPYVYDYTTKLCRRQAEGILNHENPNVRAIGQGEPRHRKYKRLKLGGGQAYDHSSVYLPFLSFK
jgi:hypothetical protein